MIEAGTAHGHWQPMFYEQGNWEQFGMPTDPTFKPLRIGPRIPSPEELARLTEGYECNTALLHARTKRLNESDDIEIDLRARLSASEARVKALEGAVGDLSDAMPDVIYVYDAGCEGSYWTEIEPTEGIYTTINFAALLASPASPAEPGTASGLFKRGGFRLASGAHSDFKIECDSLTDSDIEAAAELISKLVPSFFKVEGVPTGGLRLAKAMEKYASDYPCGDGSLLIVDDVLTSGGSMERYRNGRDAYGAVIFARGPLPGWVTSLFSMTQPGTASGELWTGDAGDWPL